MNKGIKIKIPEGCEARIEGNEIILELKENEYERMVGKAIQKASDELEKTSESTSYFSPIGHSRLYADGTVERPTIGYLIKQKEQKPTITIDQLKSFMLQYLQDAANKKDDSEIEADTDKYAKKILEYSLEQKPVPFSCSHENDKLAEWSKDYREEDLRTRFAFYTYKDEDGVLYLSNVFVEETSRNKGFGTKILQAAEKIAETIGAITIRLKVKQNSPANDWYRKHGYGYMTFEGDYDWLEKTLEYLKPIKPEWSKEDEEKIDGIIRIICTARECSKIANIGEGKEDNSSFYNGLVLFLKALKPHWKPSEEQMDALDEYIWAKEPNKNKAKDVISLYRDLKKLMKE